MKIWHIYWVSVYTQKPRESEGMTKSVFVTRKLVTMDGFKIIEEAYIPSPSGNLKPDLVIVDTTEHGDDVNTSDGCGRTPLHFTALGEDGRFVLHKNPDINVRGEIAKLLSSRGANVNAQTKNGITTLHAATQNRYTKVVEALLEYNADVNSTVKTGNTALNIAAQNCHLEVVEVLLKFGAIVDSKVFPRFCIVGLFGCQQDFPDDCHKL
jgi:ankyrin repeat protein